MSLNRHLLTFSVFSTTIHFMPTIEEYRDKIVNFVNLDPKMGVETHRFKGPLDSEADFTSFVGLFRNTIPGKNYKVVTMTYEDKISALDVYYRVLNIEIPDNIKYSSKSSSTLFSSVVEDLLASHDLPFVTVSFGKSLLEGEDIEALSCIVGRSPIETLGIVKSEVNKRLIRFS